MADIDPLQMRFDGFELAEAEGRLTRQGQPVPLAPKAFDVLCALARQAPNLVTKADLLDQVWGHQHVSESVLKTTISELRAALADDARQPRYIETAARRGYRFIGAANRPAPAASVDTTAALPAQDTAAPLIGRSEALGVLRQAWHHALAGRRQVCWVAGEAGVGKTTLIDGFAADGAAAVRARGQCVEQFGAGEPYLPVLEAIGALCRDDPALPPMMRSIAPTWLLQLPWLCDAAERDALRRELAGASQDRMLREFGELLDRYTETKALLLVTEDLHWSDHATVRLIDHVARRRQPARLMWLASFRLAEVIAEDHPLKALRHELRMHRLCKEIVLDPFSERELADYIERRLPGADVPEGLVRMLHLHTDGLPLFVVNVIDDLASQKALDRDAFERFAASRVGGLPVPENLAGVIEKRITRLPAESRSMLEAASVCGDEFRPATLADAMARDVEWVAQRCDELAREQQWLRRPELVRLADGGIEVRHGFAHALYRHVFYQRTGPLARAQMHGRVAASMARARAAGATIAASELALHFERGHDLPEALRHHAEAAESALRHFAPTEAMHISAHALRLLPRCPESEERDALEMALLGPRGVAASQLLGVTAPETVEVFERVQVLCERVPAKTSRALELGLGWSHFVRGDYAGAHALATRIDTLARARDDRLLHAAACNLMAATSTFQGRLDDGRQRLEEGLAAFAAYAERAAYVPFVVDLGVAMHARSCLVASHLGLIDQAQSQLNAALARAAALRQPFARMLALAFAGNFEVRLGRLENVRTVALALQQAVAEHGFFEPASPARWLRGWVLARDGDPEAGHALIKQAVELQMRQGRLGGGIAGVLGHAADALALAGRWSDAQRQLDEACALARRIGERIFVPDLLLLQARIDLGRGDVETARESMRASASEASLQGALWLELAARVALCETEGATPQDRAALAHASGRLREGLGTPLALRAQALRQSGKRATKPVR